MKESIGDQALITEGSTDGTDEIDKGDEGYIMVDITDERKSGFDKFKTCIDV